MYGVYIFLFTYTNLYHYIEDFCSFMQAWCSAYLHPFYNRSIGFIKFVDFPDCVGRFWKIFLQRKDLELVIRSPASRFCDGGPWPRVWSSVRLTCLALSCVLLSGRAMHRSSWNATAICVQAKSHNNCTCYAARGWPVIATQRCLQICDSGDMSLSRLQDVSVQQVIGMTIRYGTSSSVYPFTDAECHPRSVWMRSCTMNSNGHCVPTGSPSHLELWETTCLWAPYSNSLNSLLVALVDLMNLDDLMTLTLWAQIRSDGPLLEMDDSTDCVHATEYIQIESIWINARREPSLLGQKFPTCWYKHRFGGVPTVELPGGTQQEWGNLYQLDASEMSRFSQ